ncbi:hypothetical protein MA16_Dca011353 [Dendrobium catenatum]|uniref:Uncharacterized protein n=1 Tax=Dendrobium catenatum TaxID=906689 RepID=A0A2I0WNW8_9ASPA|nr:hypothetical protein MA16_Dca011353 [Dendrobium catenatum]
MNRLSPVKNWSAGAANDSEASSSIGCKLKQVEAKGTEGVVKKIAKNRHSNFVIKEIYLVDHVKCKEKVKDIKASDELQSVFTPMAKENKMEYSETIDEDGKVFIPSKSNIICWFGYWEKKLKIEINRTVKDEKMEMDCVVADYALLFCYSFSCFFFF